MILVDNPIQVPLIGTFCVVRYGTWCEGLDDRITEIWNISPDIIKDGVVSIFLPNLRELRIDNLEFEISKLQTNASIVEIEGVDIPELEVSELCKVEIIEANVNVKYLTL